MSGKRNSETATWPYLLQTEAPNKETASIKSSSGNLHQTFEKLIFRPDLYNIYIPQKFQSSHLKIGLAPKGKVCLPSIIFQVRVVKFPGCKKKKHFKKSVNSIYENIFPRNDCQINAAASETKWKEILAKKSLQRRPSSWKVLNQINPSNQLYTWRIIPGLVSG